MGDTPPGVLRRVRAALTRGLYRPLAEDDDRAAYWVRHVRHGVALTETCAVAALVYVLLTPTAAGLDSVVLVLAALTILAAPLLLRLPLAAMMRDRRGPLFFYSWSIVVTAIVVVVARIDGGATSPLYALLFVTLGFMAVAYPPYGVLAMGAIMTAGYLLVVAQPDLTLYAVFISVVMAAYTVLCALASANSWASYDRQMLLIGAQRMLAATDELTGAPNRRAFLDRLGAAIEGAGSGGRSVVCLVDLDGFKAVNDRSGHLAGDAVLKTVATALAGAVRETDTVARLGGDEFAVLAEVTPQMTGEVLAERLRSVVARAGRRSGVTASVGVAPIEGGDDMEAVLHRADEGMYRAKSSGGDRVDAGASDDSAVR
jgi:diguanylate cyclase (GGDEF)-like protein